MAKPREDGMILKILKDLDSNYGSKLQRLQLSGAARLTLSLSAHSGDAFFVFPLVFVLWWLGTPRLRTIAVLLAAGIVLSLIFTYIIKFSVRRPRPPGEWGQFYRRTDPYSFPSGHAAKTMAIAVVFMGCHSWWAGVLMLHWSALVGFARTALGVHYLSDITVGYVIGLAAGTAVCLFELFSGFSL